MAAGNQTLPRPVKLQVNIIAAACGVEHTALLSSRGNIFSMGMGWFGRLGQGKTGNLYTPEQAKFHAAGNNNNNSDFHKHLIAKEVHCGANFTAVITPDDELFMCGQDRMCCKPEHQLTFTKFDAIKDGIKLGSPKFIKVMFFRF